MFFSKIWGKGRKLMMIGALGDLINFKGIKQRKSGKNGDQIKEGTQCDLWKPVIVKIHKNVKKTKKK